MGPPQTMVRRRRRPSSPAPAAPLEDDDLLGEILLRLPPRPSSLPRASLACKRWRRLVTDRGFLRRLRARHRREPPLLGIFTGGFEWLDFTPLLDPPDRIPAARLSLQQSRDERWIFCGCRYGLALLFNADRLHAVVYDPLTGRQRQVAFPPGFDDGQENLIGGAAMVCAAREEGHVHGDCYSSPFKLVLARTNADRTRVFARLYDSESGAWGNLISELGKLLPMKPGMENAHIQILEYAEESNAMFLVIDISVFMIQLDSLQWKHIFESNLRTTYYPYTNFCAGGRVIGDRDDEPEMPNNT